MLVIYFVLFFLLVSTFAFILNGCKFRTSPKLIPPPPAPKIPNPALLKKTIQKQNISSALSNVVFVAGQSHTGHLGLPSTEEVRSKSIAENTNDCFVNIEATIQKIPSPVVQVIAALRHTLFLTEIGDVYGIGVMGRGHRMKQQVVQPAKVSFIKNVVNVAVTKTLTFYLTSEGKLYSTRGGLHLDKIPKKRKMLYNHAELGKVSKIYNSNRFVYAVCQRGVYFWKVGEGSRSFRIADTKLQNISIAKIAIGDSSNNYCFTVILTTDGIVHCKFDEFNLRALSGFIPAMEIESRIGKVVDVAAGSSMVFVNVQGDAYCCFDEFQTCYTTSIFLEHRKQLFKLEFGTTSPVTRVFANYERTYFLTASQELFALGDNVLGHLGIQQRKRYVRKAINIVPDLLQSSATTKLANVAISRDCTFLLFFSVAALAKLFRQKAFTDVKIHTTT